MKHIVPIFTALMIFLGACTGAAPEIPIQTESEVSPMTVEIIIGAQTFTADLCDNDTARAFTAMLPLELDMTELNGNEKYYYLDSSLPTDATRPEGIHTGDLMLYGRECIVLFYDSFSTSYTYTPIGHIQDAEGLAAAVGSGNVTVAFKLK